MIQSIYTSVSNADVVPCGKKGQTIKSDPIPLLRNNYLGEYRTELEKAKVRKNLGIADNQTLQWGNIFGFIENQEDLVQYIESKWVYENEISEDIKTVEQALDYVIYFVSNFKSDNETIARLDVEVKQLVNQLELTKNQLQQNIDTNSEDINTLRQNLADNVFSLEQSIVSINDQIIQINENLKVINVDANILNWIKNSASTSSTIKLDNDQTLEVLISQAEKNAVSINNGIYVYDYSEDIAKISKLEEDVKTIQDTTQELDSQDIYNTNLTDDTTAPITLGGISEGTPVSKLRGKTITEILDTLIFPSTVRPLEYPMVEYTNLPTLVSIGSSLLYPILTFTMGDSGGEIRREETITGPDNIIVSGTTYDKVGTYSYKGTVFYSEGNYLINNKGETTDIRIEAGQLSAEVNVTATYPWYTSEIGKTDIEQQLVAFGETKELEFPLNGKAIIKLPGSNTQLYSFMADTGLGYLSVDLDGWEETSEIKNGINYRVWTKKDSYPSIISHKLKFNLAL